jgi:hypothetical protein
LDLTNKEFEVLIEGNCEYCKRSPITWFGIDRVVPSLGYMSKWCMMLILMGETRVRTFLEIGRDGLVNGRTVEINARAWGAVIVGAIVYL